MSDALLLVAHGTRSAAGAAEARALLDRVRAARPRLPVALGNLELAGPTIGQAIGRLVAAGAAEVTAVPLLLFRARHAKHDIPAALDAERRRHPGVRLRYGAPLGVDLALADLVAARVRAAVLPSRRAQLSASERAAVATRVSASRRAQLSANERAAVATRVSASQRAQSAASQRARVAARLLADTAVVLVRAGSTDPDAWLDVRAAARLLATRARYLAVEPAFAGIAEPGIDTALARCREQGARRIVAVPYLLFAGELCDRVRCHAEAFAAQHPDTAVATAAHLGPDPRLAPLVLERHDEAAAPA